MIRTLSAAAIALLIVAASLVHAGTRRQREVSRPTGPGNLRKLVDDGRWTVRGDLRPADHGPRSTVHRLPSPQRPAPRARSPWQRIDGVVQEAIDAGQVPGAVVLVSCDGRIVYRKAFGNRALLPAKEPMTPDTLFDLASLTKVIATTSSVMALLQDGKIRLNDPV